MEFFVDMMVAVALVFVTHGFLRENRRLRRRLHAMETALRTNARNIRLARSCFSPEKTSGILTIHKGSVSSSVRATFQSDR